MKGGIEHRPGQVSAEPGDWDTVTTSCLDCGAALIRTWDGNPDGRGGRWSPWRPAPKTVRA